MNLPRISVVVLLVLLLQPAAALAGRLLTASEPTMSCCRTKRNCCCRKDGKKAPAFAVRLATECERDCSQIPVAPKPAAFINAGAIASGFALTFVCGTVSLPRPPFVSSKYFVFLYQRPPPFLS